MPRPRHDVVDTVGERDRHDAQHPGDGPAGAAREAQAREDRGGPHEASAVLGAQDEAVGQRGADVPGYEVEERLAPERGEAQGPAPVDRQEGADREVTEAAGPVVEEDAQGVSARSAATRASMLATEVRPSRRKRTVADPSGPGLRASRIIFVGNAASSSGSTSASPQ